ALRQQQCAAAAKAPGEAGYHRSAADPGQGLSARRGAGRLLQKGRARRRLNPRPRRTVAIENSRDLDNLAPMFSPTFSFARRGRAFRIFVCLLLAGGVALSSLQAQEKAAP